MRCSLVARPIMFASMRCHAIFRSATCRTAGMHSSRHAMMTRRRARGPSLAMHSGRISCEGARWKSGRHQTCANGPAHTGGRCARRPARVRARASAQVSHLSCAQYRQRIEHLAQVPRQLLRALMRLSPVDTPTHRRRRTRASGVQQRARAAAVVLLQVPDIPAPHLCSTCAFVRACVSGGTGR